MLVAAAALIDCDNKVLVTQRPQGKPMAGLWEFPGGKMREAETPETCLIREIREELLVELQPACLAPLTFASHAYDEFHLLMHLFAVRSWQGTPQACDGQAMKWLQPNALFSLPMPEADRPLLAHLCAWL